MRLLAEELDDILKKYCDMIECSENIYWNPLPFLSDFLSEITDAYERREKALGVDLDKEPVK